MKELKIFFVIGMAAMILSVQAQADPKSRTSITRTSPNHTEIVIHDYSPQAKRDRRRHLEYARRRREVKERRAHELELARIRASKQDVSIDVPTSSRRTQSRVNRSTSLASIRERQRRNAYKPAPFFNGGQFTGFTYGGFGNFGFNRGFNPGYGFNFNRGFRRSYRPSTLCRPVRRSYRAPRIRRGRCR